ncbi:uncharacterized protein PFL1_04209 [Pseudozyma flocculosa PF-1]|uniref:ELYS-like domain-containing protein n=2 Tax=Pseudozyma flocculosa TaxID=84751 RepID=A0A5C3EVL2_9BASI|nr:uncharacterized protein PFL1_04209 [Pseudozyma flocculosa PF-1]EPQ28382.1 hypothetical protein PFL1_04209 [Pseudozyma flocculosa PF-1]SPO35537.1 uncharacterized protein PSFLO_01008 [Pseudozyma flocculosa]
MPATSVDSGSFVVVERTKGRDMDTSSQASSIASDDDALAKSMTQESLLWFRPSPSDTGPTSASWPQDVVQDIQARRTQLPGGKLFLDELLLLAEVDTRLYPPTSHDALSDLLSAIYTTSTFDSLKQSSLVYYLLKDYDAFIGEIRTHTQDGGESFIASAKADAFAVSSFILPHFKDLMDGYWLLDRGRYEDAVPLLTSPDFIPKIYRTLFLPPHFESHHQRSRTPLERSRLLLRFLRTSTQPTTSPPQSAERLEELDMEVQATCWVRGPTKAMVLVREIAGQLEDEQLRPVIRSRLLDVIFRHCFAPPNAVAIKNLLGCFLDADEEIGLETFVLSPPASMQAIWAYIAADVLIVRFINEGRYMDAVRLDRRLGPDVREGHSSGTDSGEQSRLVEKRKRLIAGAREILPEVQKELLRIEESLEVSTGHHVDVDQAEAVDASAVKEQPGELKMSWEHVPRPNGAAAPVPASPIGTASKLTPLSASPALRRTDSSSPSTQASLLSAVVRASSSPKTTSAPARGQQDSGGARSFDLAPGSSSLPKVGFLANNSLAFGQASSSRQTAQTSADGDRDMDEDAQGVVAGSQPLAPSTSAFASKPGYRLASSTAQQSAADPEMPSTAETASAAPQSPWRNAAPLSSTSPFSGQPKIPSNAFIARLDASQRAGSSSASAYPFRPAITSPFVASTVASSRDSPRNSSLRSPSLPLHGSQKLTGAVALISRQGRRRPNSTRGVDLYDDEEEGKAHDVDEDEDEDGDEDEDEDEDQDQDIDTDTDADAGADDTFVGRTGRSGTKLRATKQVGRLVSGRVSLGEVGTSHDDDDEKMQAAMDREVDRHAATGGRARRAAQAKGSTSKSKAKASGMPRSQSEAALKPAGRQTRSTTSVNRKPLTLSNLAANDEEHAGRGRANAADTRPVARRTRAATAELESQQGDDQASQARTDGDATQDATSTIYSISEVGEEMDEERDGLGKLPSTTNATTKAKRSSKSGGGKAGSGAAKKKANGPAAKSSRSVRRSSRLSSVEPESQAHTENQENEPPRRRKAAATSASGRAARSSSAATVAANDEGAAESAAAGVRTRSGRRTMPGSLGDD